MKNELFIIFLIVYLLYNIFTFAVYGYDKYCAIKGKWRVSEKRLIGLAFFFGGVGAFLGMRVFRHKIRHLQFRILIPAFMTIQVVIWVIVAKCVL